MQNQVQDPNLKLILEKLTNFGFNFHGYDETAMPLVVAPNGQIVPINVAIHFANTQITEDQNKSSGSPEDMQNISSVSFESSIDSTHEQEKNLDQTSESKESIKNQNTQKSSLQVQNTAPIVKTPAKVQDIKPYGMGFDPKSFSVNNVDSVKKFISSNQGASQKKSNTWLALMFKKFLEENKI